MFLQIFSLIVLVVLASSIIGALVALAIWPGRMNHDSFSYPDLCWNITCSGQGTPGALEPVGKDFTRYIRPVVNDRSVSAIAVLRTFGQRPVYRPYLYQHL